MNAPSEIFGPMKKKILEINNVLSKKIKEGSGFLAVNLYDLEKHEEPSSRDSKSIISSIWGEAINFIPQSLNSLRGKDFIYYQSPEYLGKLQHMPRSVISSLSNIVQARSGWLNVVTSLFNSHGIPIVWISSDELESEQLGINDDLSDIIILDFSIDSADGKDWNQYLRLRRWAKSKAAIIVGKCPYSVTLATILWQSNFDLYVIQAGAFCTSLASSIEKDKSSHSRETLLFANDTLGYPKDASSIDLQVSQYRSGTTSIINLYRRTDKVVEIYNALIKQTQPIQAIYLWINSMSDKHIIEDLREKMPRARFIVSDENVGVWARFAMANLVTTEFCVIFDDDTVPGEKWIENCLNTYSQYPGLLGTVGLIYSNDDHYMNHLRIGWPNPNADISEVDIVGHSWFFKTADIKYYWGEYKRLEGTEFCGEDMHFSFALQKHGIRTYVPPHPHNDKAMWGSINPEYGADKEAISMSGKGSYMDLPFKSLIKKGWQLLRKREMKII